MCFRAAVRDLPPTPSKFHYIFNLRDLSRVYSGLMMTTPDRFDKVHQFLRVWRNECVRVFFDRLINDADRNIIHVRLICSVMNSELTSILIDYDSGFLRVALVTSHRKDPVQVVLAGSQIALGTHARIHLRLLPNF